MCCGLSIQRAEYLYLRVESSRLLITDNSIILPIRYMYINICTCIGECVH